jgi:hypothetical protein
MVKLYLHHYARDWDIYSPQQSKVIASAFQPTDVDDSIKPGGGGAVF